MLIVLCRSGGVLLAEDPDAGELAESDTNEPVVVIERALVDIGLRRATII